MECHSHDQRLYKVEFVLRRLSGNSNYNCSQPPTLEFCTNKLKYQILAVADLKTRQHEKQR